MTGGIGEGSQGKQEILFEYAWAVVREIDRINRASQVGVPLDARIHKLRAMAEPFLYDGKGEVREEKASWVEAWEEVSADETAKNRHEVRWRQFRLLIRLFHGEGMFLDRGVSWERLAFAEMDTT